MKKSKILSFLSIIACVFIGFQTGTVPSCFDTSILEKVEQLVER